MVIQHNIMALNSYNKLGTNNTMLSKNLEKLSSGYKINRAGDDAAGLAISEKMKAQITGLERATDNAQDAVSLVQTAEGAMTEMHSMLNRMVELATQAANGTYDTADRQNLQAEIDKLVDEINRISDETNFNGIKLLDGSMGPVPASIDTEAAEATVAAGDIGTVLTGIDISDAGIIHQENITISGLNTTQGGYSISLTSDGKTWTASASEGGSSGKKLIFTADDGSVIRGTMATVTGKTELTGTSTVTVTGTNDSTVSLTGKLGKDVLGSAVKVNGKTYEFVEEGGKTSTVGAVAVEIGVDDADTVIAQALNDAILKNDMSAVDKTNGGTTKDGEYGVTLAGSKITLSSHENEKTPAVNQQGTGLRLQIGDSASQNIKVSVADMDATALGIDDLSVIDADKAASAVDTIRAAINSVSAERAKLGATQNRLEYTINNLTTTTENLTASESRIRDTDMAEEMMAYTKNNVLAQAAQSMLAQANQQPQMVLQLLQ